MTQKVITVGEYTVSEMATLEGCRMRIHQGNLDKERAKIYAKYSGDAELSIDDQAMLAAFDEWALVASCVVPFIPMDDYMTLPLTVTRPILDAVQECNADMVSGEQSKKN